MMQLDFERLRSMGLTPALANQAMACAAQLDGAVALAAMRLAVLHRETVQLHDGAHEHTARVLPRLARALAEEEDALAVGDWVLAAPDAHGEYWVHARVPPQTRLVRRDADGRRHPVVANVDTALLVMGLDADFNPRRMERFLALVQGSGVAPVIVLSKADTVADARALFARMQTLRERLPAGVEIVALDARDAEAAACLAQHTLPGRTLALLGSSGAGKSTLTNTLLGAARQDTGAVRESDGRGQHTTTARSLFRLPGGACVIDTPGLRALRPDADEARVAATFGDVAALAPLCRFRNCTHREEPGCAVREGVADDRLRNYHKLLREAKRDTMSALERQRQVAMWKARGRAGAARAKAKRGIG
ncbi:ribosome small subunit-dependent GTPase A [Piscinibacter sp.]|uniref:ribosome small subunit-dependent GTPase A n=1 Tax=Piscinibacter sp. TaxID=1903157 RepID=UPI001B7651A3|nr:ribosome small subunit-dependent GTPase A [Piscinibacter sp.]MBP5992267.1 ribosome small subunit-dependent GTPase A [Piscinibacter sp.]MBP6029638.1 ribosome small subunit-dependent GTPase A [Piscinibacter sp.]